jgi:hypothetical protein
VPDDLSFSVNTDAPIRMQRPDTFFRCALLAVNNAVGLPQDVLAELVAKVPPLTALSIVLNRIHGADKRFTYQKVRITNNVVLNYLATQTSGQYVLSFDGHCVAYDATRHIIFDGDSRYPAFGIIASPENLKKLKISRFNISRCYKVDFNNEQEPSKKRKRKRKRNDDRHENDSRMLNIKKVK